MKNVFQEVTPFAADKVGFGLYHFGQAGVDAFGYREDNTFAYHGYDREQCNYQESLRYMNFYSYHIDESSFLHLRRIREAGCVTWMHYLPFVAYEERGVKKFALKAGWKEEITQQVEACKAAGLWDTVAGFQYDEPMLRVDADTFEEFSAFMATFGKRQLGVFSIYEIKEGTHPRSNDPEFGMTAHVINPSCCRYLTDIAFDWYPVEADYDKFRAYSDLMLNDIQTDDIHLWYVPTTWTYYANPKYTEDVCIRHLEMSRKLLLEAKHPGGLFCYTWRSWGETKNGLDYFLDTNNPERWNRLQESLVEIGREVTQIPLKPLSR